MKHKRGHIMVKGLILLTKDGNYALVHRDMSKHKYLFVVLGTYKMKLMTDIFT